MSEAMNLRNVKNDFSYEPEDIRILLDFVIKEKQRIRENHQFISQYNTGQLVEMLFHASAKQIEIFEIYYLQYIDMPVKLSTL